MFQGKNGRDFRAFTTRFSDLFPQTFSLHPLEIETFSTLLKDFSLVLTEVQSFSRSFFSTLTLETTIGNYAFAAW